MESPDAKQDRRWRRFSLRSVFLALVAAAIFCWWIGERYFRQETIALADAVAAFNTAAAADPIGALQPPLTEREVLAAITKERSRLTDPRDIAVFDAITASNRMPTTSKLRSINRFQDQTGAAKDVWWVNLQVTHADGFGYGLRVRENSSP